MTVLESGAVPTKNSACAPIQVGEAIVDLVVERGPWISRRPALLSVSVGGVCIDRNATSSGRRVHAAQGPRAGTFAPSVPAALENVDDTKQGRVSRQQTGGIAGSSPRPCRRPWHGSWPFRRPRRTPSPNVDRAGASRRPADDLRRPRRPRAGQRAVALQEGPRQPRLRQGLPGRPVRRRRARQERRSFRTPRRSTARKGKRAFRGNIGWYRTHIDVPVDGMYAIRFESVNHRARCGSTASSRPSTRASTCRSRSRVAADGRHPPQARRARRLARSRGDEGRRLAPPVVQLRRHQPRGEIRRIGASEISHPEMNTKLAGATAVVDIKVHLRNNLEPRALGAKGALMRGERRVPIEFPAEPLAKGGTEVLQTQVRVERPDLWSPARRTSGSSSSRSPASRRTARGSGSARCAPTAAACCSTASRSGCAARRSTRTSSAAATRCGPIDQDRIVGHLKAIDANATRSQHPIDPGLLERFDAAGIMVWQGVGPTDAPGSWTSKRRAARTRRRTARARTCARASCTRRSSRGTSPTRSPAAVTRTARSRTSSRCPPSCTAIDPSRPGRARHLGRASAAQARADLPRHRHDRLDELHRLVRVDERQRRPASRADQVAPRRSCARSSRTRSSR